jgi:hypothetical protein
MWWVASVHNHKHPNIQKGRLLGDCIDTLSHAQMFLKFFPLHVFEPLVPKWQHDAKSKESPQSGMPEITMSLFVGWLALWVAMMVVHLPSRDMYWNSLQDAIYNCPLFHEWGLHRYFEELLSVFSLPEYGPDDMIWPDDMILNTFQKTPCNLCANGMICWLHIGTPAIRLEPYLL